MKWFCAVLVLECRIGRESPELWDEQVRLIRAKSAEAAYLAARRFGKRSETHYKNSEGAVVRWRFAGVGELEELSDQRLASGIEVFSKLTRKERPRVPSKSKLIAFWSKRNANKTARELLEKPLK